jgi:hypothetical protein
MSPNPGFFKSCLAWLPALMIGLLAGCGSDGIDPPPAAAQGADLTAPTVSVQKPLHASSAVCLTRVVSATFSEPVDAATINTASFGVTDNGVDLRSAASYSVFGGAAGVTNSGGQTVIGGDLGTTAACTLITGFHDAANVYTQTPLNIGAVGGHVVCGPPAPGTSTTLAAAMQARADALAAYNELAALPAGCDPAAGQLGGLVLPPAVYTSAGGRFDITTGDLTLDAQGDADAVWVFQSAAALTVGLSATPRRVLLINGAQAGRVFWQVGSAARIEDGSVMAGTVIAPAGVTVSTAGQTAQTTWTGRALGLTASVTLVNTTLIVP